MDDGGLWAASINRRLPLNLSMLTTSCSKVRRIEREIIFNVSMLFSIMYNRVYARKFLHTTSLKTIIINYCIKKSKFFLKICL